MKNKIETLENQLQKIQIENTLLKEENKNRDTHIELLDKRISFLENKHQEKKEKSKMIKKIIILYKKKNKNKK